MPDLDPLATLSNLPGFALRRAANAMMADLSARLAELDLRISDATTLLLIGDRTDLTSSEIGKALAVQRANMVPLLSRLEIAGFIRRIPLDRKSQAVVLTDAGRDRLDQVRSVTTRFEKDLINRIPEEHRAHFLPALHALAE